MAVSLNNGGSGSRRRRGGSTLSDINVTPFVDVMLVLLIIFMLTAHVMEFGIQVDVPKVRAVKDTAQELPVVTITKDGTTYLNEKPININDLKTTIAQRFPKSTAVYVRADKDTIWDPIAQVMATLGEAKLAVNVVTQPEDTAAKGRR
ncbi:MAG TPA: biopolymer transporter ExbD [Bryobacteraceae bacterium]|nr:biopolymer transporter ExbD [Bryobacteraceae bacterium]